MLNDGGLHQKQYYEIDLVNNIIEKKEDYCNKDLSLTDNERISSSYIGKVLKSVKINEKQHQEIEKMFEKLLESEQKAEPNKTFIYERKLKYKDKAVDISEEDFNKFLNKIQ